MSDQKINYASYLRGISQNLVWNSRVKHVGLQCNMNKHLHISCLQSIRELNLLKLGTGNKIIETNGLLDCVHQLSVEPEEHLFITVHHAFEIWFKQILFDMKRIIFLIKQSNEERVNLTEVSKLLVRCRDIFRFVISYFDTIETIGQLNFVNFREKLTGGSGFQSYQFRMIENMFGLKECHRVNPVEYKGNLDEKELKDVNEIQDDTLFKNIESWLEKIFEYYNKTHSKSFEVLYEQAVKKMLGGETDQQLGIVYDKQLYESRHVQQAKQRKVSCLSWEAFLGALIVNQFPHQPEYQIPYLILTYIVDLDEVVMRWRARHINMVHRMIGIKVGTGGTSGYDYLSSTFNDRYKIFLDLMEISTYILPSKHFVE